jgi:hypothetical protein
LIVPVTRLPSILAKTPNRITAIRMKAGAVLAIPTQAGLITPAHPIPVAVIPAAAPIDQENLFNA